jgi:hypothetical protein
MTCTACTAAETGLTGAYDFNCLGCCVRLAGSTRPDKARAAAMLAVIAKFPGSPSRDKIIEKLKDAQPAGANG